MSEDKTLTYRDIIKLLGSINLKVSNINDLWNQLVRKFDASGLFSQMHVGRIEIDVMIESGVFNMDGSDEFYTYDSGNPVNESCAVRQNYPSVNGGMGRVTAYPVENYIFTDDDIEVLRGFGNIISLFMARIRLSANVEKSHYIDMNTGLNNADGLRMEGSKLEAVGELFNMSVIFINLRNFNEINTTIGVRQGDEVIKRFAKLLNTLVSMNRGIAARLGGDRFVLFIPKSQLENALSILEDVRIDLQILDRTEHIHLHSWTGVFTPSETDNFDDCINGAAIACDMAHEGKSYVPIYMSDEAIAALNPR